MSLRLAGLFIAVALTAANAAPQNSSIVGVVKGPDGKLVAGAEVRLSPASAKGANLSTKTDAHGNYEFKGLVASTYKLTAYINNVAKGTSNVTARSNAAVTVNFDLGKTAAKKKGKKHLVWVSDVEAGSNLPRGHWAEADDNSDQNAAPTDHVGNEAVRNSFQNSRGFRSQGP